MRNTPEESTSWSSLLIGVTIGAVIGAAAALLYAPKSGQETREDLLQRIDEMKERIDDTSRQLAQLAREKVQEAKSDLGQAVEAGREAAKARAEELRRQVGME